MDRNWFHVKLSRMQFYVKSFFCELETSKTVGLTILVYLNVQFLLFFFRLGNRQKLISRKIERNAYFTWNHSLWNENVKNCNFDYLAHIEFDILLFLRFDNWQKLILRKIEWNAFLREINFCEMKTSYMYGHVYNYGSFCD